MRSTLSSSGPENFGPTSTSVVGSPTFSALTARREPVEEFVGDPLVHVHALVADADLAAILEARDHGGAHRGADVGILGDDERRLAAEFEPQHLQVIGGIAEDRPCRRARCR